MVIQTGYSIWGARGSFRHERYPFLAIELITAGDGLFLCGGREWPVQRGDVCLVHTGASSALRTGPSEYLHKRMVVLKGNRLLPELLDKLGLSSCDILRAQLPQKLIGLLKEVRTLLSVRTPGYFRDLSALAYRILLELSYMKGFEARHPVVECVIQSAEMTPSGRLKIEDLAAKAGVSKSRLYQLFAEEMGCSPHEYFLRKKFEFACTLLQGSSLSIKQISTQMGFGSPFDFSRRFKSRYGCSPSDFRTFGATH